MAKIILDVEGRISDKSAKNTQKQFEQKIKPVITPTINDKAYIQALDALNRASASIKTGQVKLTDISHTVKGSKIKEFTVDLKNNNNELTKYRNILNSLDPANENYKQDLLQIRINANNLQKTQSSLNKDMQASKKEFKSFGKTLLENAKQFASWTSATQIVMQLANAVKQLVREFVRLDKAFTNIQMVTNYTNEQMSELKNTYIEMAKQLSTTVDDVANASNDWLRMGMSVREANQALEAAIKLAKIAGTETSQATTMLISTMKGYKLEAQDLISVVDKLSAVDMQSASSSEDLAESISKVASVAYSAGISLDKLIAYAATIKDVTQQSAESVGTALNSIFSRMSKVAAGVDVDDFGESLNDVDKVLKRYNISLRDTSGDMRSMEVVLEEIANKWDTLTTAERNQISTALGGTRQRNAVVTLLNNYDEVLRLTTTSLESAGTAEQKFAIYSESVEAKVNKLKASFQEMAETTINSNFVKTLLEIGNALLNVVNYTGGIVPLLGTILSTLLLIKGVKVAQELYSVANAVTVLSGTLQGALGILGLVFSVVMAIVGFVKSSVEEARKRYQQYIESLQSVQQEVKELRDEFIRLNASTEEASNDSLKKSWDMLYNAAYKLRLEVDRLNQSYEYYLQLSGQIETIGLEEELKATEGQYKSNKKERDRLKSELDYLQYAIKYAKENNLSIATFKYGRGKTVEEAEAYYNQLFGQYESYQSKVEEYETKQAKLSFLQQYTARINSAKAAYAKLSQLDTDQAKKTAQTVLNEINTIIEEVKANYPSGVGDELVGDFEETRKSLENIINENLVGKFANIQISNIKALQEAEEAENEALKKRLTLQEKILAVQEAQEKLAQAQNKRARVYRAGRGFVYEQDFSRVSAAQKELRSAQQSLREYRSSIKYEEEIALLQEASNEWEKLFINDEEFKKFVNGLTVTMEELGSTTEEILNWMTNTIQEFKNRNGINATETTSGSWDYFSGLSSNGLISPGGYNISGSSLGNVNMSSSNLSTGFTPVSYSTSSGNITNINIGSISLPGVTDAQGFADGLVNLSYQVGTSHK